LNNDKNYEEWCINIARNNIIPAILLDYAQIEIDDKQVAIIQVPKGKNKPYQTLDAKFLIRVGTTNRTATANELPNTITIEKFKAGVSYAVNPIIIKFMDNLG
jgi:ATP-dependent DNA helicase RecG